MSLKKMLIVIFTLNFFKRQFFIHSYNLLLTVISNFRPNSVLDTIWFDTWLRGLKSSRCGTSARGLLKFESQVSILKLEFWIVGMGVIHVSCLFS